LDEELSLAEETSFSFISFSASDADDTVSSTLSSRISTSPLFDAADDASSTTSIFDSCLSSETLLALQPFSQKTRSQTMLFYVFSPHFQVLASILPLCKGDVTSS
jgi:hypothetical protein